MTAQRPNEIVVEGGIIHVICHGKQDEWTVRRTITQFVALADEMEAAHQTVKCLVDLSDDVGYDIGARNTATEAMKTRAVPTAIVGISKNTALQTVFNFMVRLAGQGDKYRIFKTAEDAETWLKSL